MVETIQELAQEGYAAFLEMVSPHIPAISAVLGTLLVMLLVVLVIGDL